MNAEELLQQLRPSEQSKKTYFDGTHRVCSPEETFERNSRYMQKLGITRVANVTGLDRIDIPVYISIRPNSRSLSTSQGKGENHISAKVSALMESIELWHAEHSQLPVLIAPYHEITETGHVMDIDQAPVRSDSQFERHRAIEWVQGVDIVSGISKWLPNELVGFNLVRQPSHQPIFLESSSGLSSGNHITEAILHALAEVIERDAMSLWELFPYEMKKDRQVDLGSIEDETLLEVIHKIQSKGLVVGVWDATSDIGVPVYTCAIIEDPGSPLWRPVPVFMGHGCHLDPAIALSRALHEAAQGRLTAISGSRDDIFQADYIRGGSIDDHAKMIDALNSGGPSISFQTKKLPVGESVQEDIDTLLVQLNISGIEEVVVCDLSHSDIGIPVVKVVVPALEPYYTALYRRGARAKRLAKEISQ